MDDYSSDPELTGYADCTGEASGIRRGAAYESPPISPAFSKSGLQHRYELYDEIDPFNEDTQILAHDGGYSSSGSSIRQSGDIPGGDLDGDLDRMSSRASSRSSVSSIPTSVLTNMADGMKTVLHNDMLSHHWENHDSKVHSKLEGQVRSIPAIRHRETAFRKPSSVKAMQMHTEDEGDDDFLTPPKRRGQRLSDVSMRSAGSSPLRKTQFYSPTGSAGKPKVKKEYPLVLLHCNLLPPSLPVPGAMGYHNQKVLREVLPSEYWRRWKLLEEKVGSVMLRERGVLISHPEDMYDLLEERLLESLDLQRPRLDHGHFLGQDENDSERDDQSVKESATDEEEGEDCPDCGGRVVRHSNAGRKWEIKVFAANGLMRAGAWAAAWREMEKVDVEVGLWLPSEIRRELERRLLEEEICQFENRLQVPHSQEPAHAMATEVRQHSLPAPTTPPAIEEHNRFVHEQAAMPSPPVTKKVAAQEQRMPEYRSVPRSSEDIDLQTLLVNYIRVLASDRRNVAIAVLSFLVVFCAIHATPQSTQSALRPFPQDILEPVSVSSSAVSLMQPSSTNWGRPTSCALPSVETSRTDVMPSFSSRISSSSGDAISSSVTTLSSSVVAAEDILGPVLDDPPNLQAEPEAGSSLENPLATLKPEPELSTVRLKDPGAPIVDFSMNLVTLTPPMSPLVEEVDE
ncbi:hypothetical protein BO94DRAFT_50830 [Aspergillus sclerotioniger CBS 115572]|uniref:Flavoprotein oxygenase n=1 Tax=Aspergillus sclerotioniger CBS 115572 TaxID=1450535 RepID=A0A317WQS5_9EURO|nr:hypothetical protein BO94DRAFT_50830 [Aspergillus sclerotioniger CBS 115572]PWY88756.1 hypothetical protein BO94DRAFT_50830 [Aspergillus sclerotioniger CBS 115572]